MLREEKEYRSGECEGHNEINCTGDRFRRRPEMHEFQAKNGSQKIKAQKGRFVRIDSWPKGPDSSQFNDCSTHQGGAEATVNHISQGPWKSQPISRHICSQ
jgi:hypothetical protein